MQNIKKENTIITESITYSPITKDKKDLSYAGFWIRFQAQLIDRLIFLIILYLLPLNYIFNKSPELLEVIKEIGLTLFLSIFLFPFLSYFYQIFMISKFGGGVGKLVSGIKVTFENGKLLSFKQSIFRQIVGYFVSGLLLGLGFFWVFREGKKQGWHDQISGSFVVYSNKAKRVLGFLTLIFLFAINIILIKNIITLINNNETLKKDFSEIIEEYKNELEIEEPADTIKTKDELMII